MTKEEIQQKIQSLLDSGQGENVYIALYMMVNEFEMTLEDALRSLKPEDYSRNYPNPQDFYSSIRVANVWLEYEFVEGYVPYMGTGATASRMISIKNQKGDLECLDGYAQFLPVEDSSTEEEVRAMILEDYYSLIPDIIKLLDQ